METFEDCIFGGIYHPTDRGPEQSTSIVDPALDRRWD